MRSTASAVLSAVLVAGCVEREAASPVLDLSEASDPGKQSASGGDDTLPDAEDGSSSSDESTGAPEASEEETGGSTDASSSGSTGGSTSSADPPGNPAWSDCQSGEECEDGVCLVYEQPAGVYVDSACSSECDDASECAAPTTGTAIPTCMTFAEDLHVCVLPCTAGEVCPDGMVCLALETTSLCF